MGERKGTNKYYPPDFDPKKHKSLAGYHGQHPLRERAKKLDKGILIIRFEMPYNIWCDGCNNPVGMGVRYNAEKSKIGMYYTTPIWQFRMKCTMCKNHYVIKTDPGNHDYVITDGARRKEQRWDPKENEQIVATDREAQKKLALDPMYKLEHGEQDKDKQKAAMPGIRQIEKRRAAFKDDFGLNQLARKKFRVEKKAIKDVHDADEALLDKMCLDIELVPEHDADAKMAQLLQFSVTESYDEKQIKKRKEIENSFLFDPSLPSGTPESSSCSSGSSGQGTPFDKDTRALDVQRRLGLLHKIRQNPFISNSSPITTSGKSGKKGFGIVRKKKSDAPEALNKTADSGQSAVKVANIESEKSNCDNEKDVNDSVHNTEPRDTESKLDSKCENMEQVDRDHFKPVSESEEEDGSDEDVGKDGLAGAGNCGPVESDIGKESSASSSGTNALGALMMSYNSSSSSDGDEDET